MTQLVTGFGVHLKVASVERSRAFYEDYLGLRPSLAYGDGEFVATFSDTTSTELDRHRGVMYAIDGGGCIEIADGHASIPDKSIFASRIESPKVSAVLRVSSLIPLLDKSSVRPRSAIKKYYWGTIEMVLQDPDGWVIAVVAPYSPREMDEVRSRWPIEVVEPS